MYRTPTPKNSKEIKKQMSNQMSTFLIGTKKFIKRQERNKRRESIWVHSVNNPTDYCRMSIDHKK